MCPTRGASLAQVILPRRLVSTDEDALHIVDSLHAMHLRSDADSVQTCRGMYWITQAKVEARVAGVDEASLLSHLFLGVSDVGSGLAVAAMISRAATWFIKARDTSRLGALFDAAVSATIAAQVAAGLAANRYYSAVSDARHKVDFDCMYGLIIPSEHTLCLLERGAIGSGVALINRFLSKRQTVINPRDYSPQFVNAEVEERLKESVRADIVLKQTLNNVKMLMDAVDSSQTLMYLSIGRRDDVECENIGVTLMRYVEALDLVQYSLALLKGSDTESRSLAVCALKKACQLLVSLISTNEDVNTKGVSQQVAFSIMNSFAPPRYHLHIMDLCLWVHDKLASLMLKPRHFDGETEDGTSRFNSKIFSRKQIDDLLCDFHQISGFVNVRLVYGEMDDVAFVSVQAAINNLSLGMNILLFLHFFRLMFIDLQNCDPNCLICF